MLDINGPRNGFFGNPVSLIFRWAFDSNVAGADHGLRSDSARSVRLKGRKMENDWAWGELNFHDGEILSVNLEYGNKRANLVIQLANPHTRVAVEAQGLYAFLMSCREPWGRGTYIFSVTTKRQNDKIKMDILFNSGDHMVIGCENLKATARTD